MFLTRFGRTCFNLLHNISFYDHGKVPPETSTRIVLGFWVFALVILANAFTGQLKAGLTVRPQPKRLQTAADIVQAEDLKIYTQRGPALPLLLALSTNEDHRLLFRRIKADSIIPYDRLWSKAVIGQVASGRAVIMGDLTTVQYQAAKHCWQFPNSELYFVREKLFSFSMVVYLNKNLPRSFVDCWNKRLSTLVESGLMSKWYEETIALAGHFSRCPKLGTKELDTVAFNHLRPVFLCYVFGLALAAATFVAEWPGNCVW
ncbi:unnamed protein product, partial [Ixodes persulcatus]